MSLIESQKTKTLADKIQPIYGDEFQILISVPKQRPNNDTRNKIPITVHLSKTGAGTELGCYVYSIYGRGEVYQTLLNNSEETLVDLTKKVGGLISKKYNSPSYVSMSGYWSLEDLIPTIKETFSFIEGSWD